jgi:transposase
MKPKSKKVSTFYGESLYDLVIPKDHFFRLLLTTIDWPSIRKELMTDTEGKPIVYSHTGRPAWDPLIIFKMLFLQRYHMASDAKIEERAKTDLTYRFFLRVPIPESVPDESTLSLYRTRWGDKKIDQIYTNIFIQIQRFGFANVKEGIVGDITHQQANIQKPTARVLILTCFEKWLKEIQRLSEQFPKLFTQKNCQKLVFATTAWLVVYREQISRKELLRKERLTLLVQKILEVQQQVSVLIGDSIPKRVISSAEWQAYLKRKTTLLQILGENVTISEKEITQKKGQRKIISLVDPEARSGYKTKKKRFTGYKVATTMTIDGFHPSVETLPGNESDMTMALPMVRKVIANAKEVPKTMCLDLGFNSVKNRRALHHLGVQPGIELEQRLNPRNPGLFSTGDFSFDFQALTVTCPAKQTTTKVTRNAQTETFLFRFPKRLCDDCSLRTNCTTSQTGRTVQFSQHVQLLTQDRAFLQTEQYEIGRKARWRLEGRYGTGKGGHSLAKTPYHGLRKANFHNLMVFIVLNLKKFIKMQYFPSLKVLPKSCPSGASV